MSMLRDRDSVQPSMNARCTSSKSATSALRAFCPASSGVRPKASTATHSPSLAERSSSAVSAMFPFRALVYDHVIFLFVLISFYPSLTPTYPQLMRLKLMEQDNANEVSSDLAYSTAV